MYKSSILFLIFVLGLLLKSCDNGTESTNDAQNKRIANRLNQIGDSLVSNIIINNANYSIPGAVIGVISPENNFSFLKSFGKADYHTGTEFLRSDGFRIGTATQSFVATLAFRFIDDGIINIDEPINKYIQVPHSGGLITIRHLLSMRSGLPDFMDSVRVYLETEPNKKWTNAELLNFAFNRVPLNFPNASTHFSNTNYLLLGMIIERVSGESLGTLIQNRILNVMNLKNTLFNNNSDFSGYPFSKGYKWNEIKVLEDVTTKYDYSWSWATSNMISNSYDLLAWAEALGTGKLLSSKSLDDMFKFEHVITRNDYNLFYGCGVMRIGPFIGFSGSIDGYEATFYYLPSRKMTIVIFTNTANDNNELLIEISRLFIPGLKFN